MKYLLQVSIIHNTFAETSDVSMAYPHAKLARPIIATYPHGYDPPVSNGKQAILLLINNAIYGLPPSGALYQDFRNKKILTEFWFIPPGGKSFLLVASMYMSDVFFHTGYPSILLIIVTDDFAYTGPVWFMVQLKEHLDR